jgi:hypothetical protein
MTEFKIKDIVFVAIEKKMQILPARVIEKLTQESADGTTIMLTLEFPGVKDPRTVPADHNIFGSVEDAREKLLARVTKSIDNMCELARKVSQERFGSVNPGESVVQSTMSDPSTGDENVFLVEMPDGTTARVRDNTNTVQP